ncbi:hypothetical protein F4808DRAFT_183548 [Astrocystis sublimbata]|nr:hypothetical protein F4808DRAFT_183548 [Astrocystis sublimbata]
MPKLSRSRKNTSGVKSQDSNGIYYLDGNYLCLRLRDGTPCNHTMTGEPHNIRSHNSNFHAAGSYQRQMVKGNYECKSEGCKHQSPNFLAILAHYRRHHWYRGSSKPLKRLYGVEATSRGKKRSVNDRGRERRRQDNDALTPVGEDDNSNIDQNIREIYGDTDDDDDDDDDDDGSLRYIDPELRKWDRDKRGPGKGGNEGGGGSSLGGQILSSNVIAASG